MQCVELFLGNQEHFMKVPGFTPYNRLKRTALAFTAFFTLPVHYHIIVDVIKQVYCSLDQSGPKCLI
jgi:hypothetical protein